MPAGHGTEPPVDELSPEELDSEKLASGKDPETLEAALLELAKVRARLSRVNRESAGRRHALVSAQTQAAALQGQIQTLTAQVAEHQSQRQQAEATLTTLQLHSAIKEVAGRLKFRKPEEAVALVDMTKVKRKDDGTYEGVEEALKELVKASPYLVETEQSPLGTPPRKGATPPPSPPGTTPPPGHDIPVTSRM